ncbi:MAG TPA: hypothetical protein VJL84_11545 [Kiloniellales bacterium]|nr:hypothetical protein [Kiloniellales bacterium]
MFSFASADAFDPLLWSGMLVVATLAALGLTSWWERRTRHGHRRRDRLQLR